MAKIKKKYKKPRVVHREKIEVLAVVCDTAWVPGQVCMKTGTCPKPRD